VKHYFKAKTTQFVQFRPLLLEELGAGVQDHNEAVVEESDNHGDDFHVDQATDLKKTGRISFVWQD
jgi:hypothetical protein